MQLKAFLTASLLFSSIATASSAYYSDKDLDLKYSISFSCNVIGSTGAEINDGPSFKRYSSISDEGYKVGANSYIRIENSKIKDPDPYAYKRHTKLFINNNIHMAGDSEYQSIDEDDEEINLSSNYDLGPSEIFQFRHIWKSDWIAMNILTFNISDEISTYIRTYKCHKSSSFSYD